MFALMGFYFDFNKQLPKINIFIFLCNWGNNHSSRKNHFWNYIFYLWIYITSCQSNYCICIFEWFGHFSTERRLQANWCTKHILNRKKKLWKLKNGIFSIIFYAIWVEDFKIYISMSFVFRKTSSMWIYFLNFRKWLCLYIKQIL